MTGKMNWRKARKFKETEEKYQAGVLDNGRVVVKPPQNSLDERARWVERQWLRSKGLTENLKKKR